jgi:aminocarboxymuconate-semialdehyde decarboxylase
MLKIDMHTHIMPAEMPRWADKFGYDGFIHLDHHKAGKARMMQGAKFFREIKSNCWDEAERIPEYAGFNTQVQVICTIPVLFAYFAKPEHCLETSRFLNDHIADICARYPKNYIGLATVPMQAPQLAVQELERCKNELNLKGIQIGSNINDKNLNEPEFEVIWETCERLGLAVMVHPWNMMGKGQMEKYWLPWLVGMPAETTRAMCSMIFGGVFDRYPNLRVCFSHAGGSFFGTIGRIEHGFNCRPDLVAVDNPNNPRNYVGRFWIDSITHDADTLRFIMQSQPASRICLGSDYPFPLGDLEIGKFIEEMALDEQTLAQIMHGAALSWLNMSAAEMV